MLLVSVASAPAQEWARKMFKVTSHDYGTVAQGAKAEYRFALTNIYKENIHVSGARASCGCVSVSIPKRTLKTWEKGDIVATLNTGSYRGYRNATITITIDEPYYAEVQLTITGHIRGDVLLDPGSVQFGSIDFGTAASMKYINVSYAGRSDWQIVDIRSANPYIEVAMTETQRNFGRVGYELAVRLKKNAPVGYLNAQLVLVTNDYQSQKIALPVEGRIVAPVTVSPASLFMGVLQPGQKVTKQLVVRGKKPLKIVSVKCPEDADHRFELKTPGDAKTLHFIPVTFTAGKEPGKIVRKIEIVTDLSGGSTTTIVASATVKAPDHASKP